MDTARTTTMRVFFNLFCRDIEAQLAFYQSLLGLPELEHKRSPIYRALDAGSTELGFNALPAYELLALSARQPQPGDALPPVTAYATFMLASPAAVDVAAQDAAARGGKVLKPPYATYYREWQAVLEDPEGQVFRVSSALEVA